MSGYDFIYYRIVCPACFTEIGHAENADAAEDMTLAHAKVCTATHAEWQQAVDAVLFAQVTGETKHLTDKDKEINNGTESP